MKTRFQSFEFFIHESNEKRFLYFYSLITLRSPVSFAISSCHTSHTACLKYKTGHFSKPPSSVRGGIVCARMCVSEGDSIGLTIMMLSSNKSIPLTLALRHSLETELFISVSIPHVLREIIKMFILCFLPSRVCIEKLIWEVCNFSKC